MFLLNARHRSVRLAWARKYFHWKLHQWARIIFSDECYVYIGDTNGKVYITRRVGEELDPRCTVPVFKQSSLRVMVWGCIMKGSKGPLVVLEYPGGKGGGMTAKRYQQQVLDGVLRNYWRKIGGKNKGLMFEQDGAPSHTAKSTKQWFNTTSIPLFPHPPQSPDLPPIENCWHELKKRLRARPRIPTSLDELIEATRECWDEIPQEVIDSYIDSMPERVKALRKAKGGHFML